MIAKYRIHTSVVTDSYTYTPQNIRLIRAGAVPEDNPCNEDNSASNCNSRFSNRDGNKEAKLTDCSFNIFDYCRFVFIF